MQRSRALDVLAFFAATAWSVPASAHAGGADAVPLLGGTAGLVAGIIVGTVPRSWQRNAILIVVALLLTPIIYLIVKEPAFPSNIGAAVASWLALGFAFFLVPAGLLGFAGYACISWVKRAIQYHREHGRQAKAENG